MSSSNSKDRTGSNVNEFVDLDPEYVPGEQGGDLNENEEQETQERQSSKRKRGVVKKYRKRAKCWNYFTEIVEDGKRIAGKCNFCGIIYQAHSTRNGTKNLNNHWPICPDNPANQAKDEMTQTKLVFVQGENGVETQLKHWVLNPHDARDAIAKMVIIDELPFRHVDKPGFRYLMSVVCPNLIMPCRTTVARDCYQLYIAERIKLKEFLLLSCQRVSITTDTWTSLQRINYMVITAHFIDNKWKLNKRIINFCTITSHKGEDIAMLLGKCLEDWGLDSKLYTITVDNAGSNSTACSALINDFIQHKRFLICGGEYLHVRCIAHILNLVVWDGLKVVGRSVKRIRAAVRFIRQSSSRLHRFKECVASEKIESKASLSLDVPTRWNSTYLMLNIATLHERAFTKYSKRDPYYQSDISKDKDGEADRPPTCNDWKQVKYLLVFLEAFYNTTKRLSGSLYVTSNLLFFEIVSIHKMLTQLEKFDTEIEFNSDELEECEDDGGMINNFKDMANRMRLKFAKYYGKPEKLNCLIYIAALFDPRSKMAGLELSIYDMFGMVDGIILIGKIKEKVDLLFEEYWKLYKPSTPESAESDETQVEFDVSNNPISGTSYAQELRRKLKRLDGGGVVRTEMQKYLNEEIQEDTKDFDVLGWWKVHGPRYPVVQAMARDILAIPVSTVASESAFSAGGRHLDSFRTSLTPKMVQALVCAQDWLKNNIELEMEETFEDLQALESELTKLSLKDNVPDMDVLNL